ncbi:hypothetical protein ACFYY8_05370 [Streptosporangium sp. NPDC001559]|uniref:hypothetical protein n=1 Tax=Streptosporangium sp. NPDC001559 TaxID=3366187 RepID=UPI0036E66015
MTESRTVASTAHTKASLHRRKHLDHAHEGVQRDQPQRVEGELIRLEEDAVYRLASPVVVRIGRRWRTPTMPGKKSL